MKPASFPTNVLLLGKTGVGKSSLLNYLFGNPCQAETGAGRPVTKADIIAHPPFEYKGMRIAIHDSWGLEPDKAAQWRQIIEKKVHENDAKDIRDWFHTIIYCIDCKRSRIDDFEIEIIDSLARDGNRLVFALTRSDVASPAERQAVEKILAEKWDFPVVPVCSQARTLLGGKKTEAFGRPLLLAEICRNLTDNLFAKALNSYLILLADKLDEASCKVMEDFEERAGTLGIFTIYGNEFKNDIKKSFERHYPQALMNSREHLTTLLKTILGIEALAQQALGANLQHNIDTKLKEQVDYGYKSPAGGEVPSWLWLLMPFFVPLIPFIMPFTRKSDTKSVVETNCDRLTNEIMQSQLQKVAKLKGESLADANFTVGKAVTTGMLPWRI